MQWNQTVIATETIERHRPGVKRMLVVPPPGGIVPLPWRLSRFIPAERRYAKKISPATLLRRPPRGGMSSEPGGIEEPKKKASTVVLALSRLSRFPLYFRGERKATIETTSSPS